MSSDSSQITGWATSVKDYSPTSEVGSYYNDPTKALGNYSNGGLVSLGDLAAAQLEANASPGSITLGFSGGIRNGSGWDFAVFENGFMFGGYLFAELAYVEVSTDGVNFARFQGISTNTGSSSGSGAFAGYDTTNVYNLAGKHQAGYGTTFDLSDLANDELVLNGTVMLDSIYYVRLVDIPGDGSYTDSAGNPIYDNWHTANSGGFDLTAMGTRYSAVPEPAHIALLAGAFVLAVATWRRRRVV